MLTVACVKAGAKYGPDYVNNLEAMVRRNISPTVAGRFVCFTDDPAGISDTVEIRPLPDGVEGWWNKLWLFAPGVFEAGERVLYLDLDTVVVGDLDAIAAYDGPFAIPRDFVDEATLNSSFMAWPGGWGSWIWERWCRAGRPEVEGGDQEWIRAQVELPVRLQDVFPGQIVSYKLHCVPLPPDGARLVSFHGQPKPHDCGRAWVKALWHDKPVGSTDLRLVYNTPLERIRAQSKASAERALPRIRSLAVHDRRAVLVGGGPSLARMEREIRRRRDSGQSIWALNGTYRWLFDRGITADVMVLLDARPDNARFIEWAHPGTTFLVASQCHPDVYDRLAGHDVVRFDLEKMGDCGTTVGTYALNLAWVLGYRKLALFGFDSSYEAASGHAYPQEINDGEEVLDVTVGDRIFRAAPWMAQQAKDFVGLVPEMVRLGGEISVHGDGLIPYVARVMATPDPAPANPE